MRDGVQSIAHNVGDVFRMAKADMQTLVRFQGILQEFETFLFFFRKRIEIKK